MSIVTGVYIWPLLAFELWLGLEVGIPAQLLLSTSKNSCLEDMEYADGLGDMITSGSLRIIGRLCHHGGLPCYLPDYFEAGSPEEARNEVVFIRVYRSTIQNVYTVNPLHVHCVAVTGSN